MFTVYKHQKNRPFSTQNIVDILQQQVKKTAVQKALDALVSSKQIALKEFGKSKIYFADQSQFQAPNEDEVQQEMQNITTIQTELYELESKRKTAEQGLLFILYYHLLFFQISILSQIMLV